MPRYEYKCESCNMIFEVTHSYKDKQEECTECGSSCLEKVFSSPLRRIKQSTRDQKPGDKVNQAISESQEDLRKQRKILEKQRNTSQ